jgi:hypothetical protein
MPPEESDFDFEAYEETDWESVESVELYFDEDGGADLYLVIDGELIDMGTLDPSEVQDVIWNDLYEHIQDYDIPFEVEEDYA